MLREVAAGFERPVLLFSGGKDSIVLLRLAEKAFRPGAFRVPVAARRHRRELPRDDRVSRPPRRASSASGCSSPRCRTRSTRAASVEENGPRASRNRLQTTTLLDAIAAAPLRLRDRRRPPRRRTRPRQRTHLQLPRRLRPLGPQSPAPRTVEPLQHPHPPRRTRPRLPALQLDRTRRLGIHPPRSPRSPLDLLQPHPPHLHPRRHALRLPRRPNPAPRRNRPPPPPSATAPSAT